MRPVVKVPNENNFYFFLKPRVPYFNCYYSKRRRPYGEKTWAVNTCQTFPGETFKVSLPVTSKSIFFLVTNVFTLKMLSLPFRSLPDSIAAPCGWFVTFSLLSWFLYQSLWQNPIIYFKNSSRSSPRVQLSFV